MVRTKTFLVFAFHPEAFVMEAIAQRIKKHWEPGRATEPPDALA
jgi:hypothetical protein